jgi:hypothetical protein
MTGAPPRDVDLEMASENQAMQGRRERQYRCRIGATEDTAARRFAAARTGQILRGGALEVLPSKERVAQVHEQEDRDDEAEDVASGHQRRSNPAITPNMATMQTTMSTIASTSFIRHTPLSSSQPAGVGGRPASDPGVVDAHRQQAMSECLNGP